MRKFLARRYVRRKVRKQGDWGRKKKEKKKKARGLGSNLVSWLLQPRLRRPREKQKAQKQAGP